jgi:hypothetical protein
MKYLPIRTYSGPHTNRQATRRPKASPSPSFCHDPITFGDIPEASVETERNRVGFVINRRLGGSCTRLVIRGSLPYRANELVWPGSGCRRYVSGSISIVVVHFEKQSDMEGEIEAKEHDTVKRI